MKHVYLIGNEGRASLYGIGTYIEQIIAYALNDSSGIQMSLVYLNSNRKEFGVEIDHFRNIRVFYIPEMTFVSDDIEKENRRYYKCVFYLLAHYIDPVDNNIFHFNYLHNHPLIWILKEKITNCKIVYTVHYLMWSSILKGNISRFCELVELGSGEVCGFFEEEKKVFNSVDKVICLSEATYSLLVKYYGTEVARLELIHNGLKDEYEFLTEQQKVKRKIELSFKPEDKIILYVGRLDEMKGLEFLIEAFVSIMDICLNTYLVIIGDGDFGSFYKQICGKWSRILFTGRLSKDLIYQFYQIADIGVLPSLHEQCSYVGIEMMMHALPMLGTMTASHMFDSGKCLRLIEKDGEIILSSSELAYHLIDFLSQDNLVLFQKNSRKRFLDQYNYEKMILSTLSCYSSLST